MTMKYLFYVLLLSCSIQAVDVIIGVYNGTPNYVNRAGDNMSGALSAPIIVAGDLSATNFVVNGTGAWTILAPVFFSNTVEFSSGTPYGTNHNSLVSFGIVTNWLEISTIAKYATTTQVNQINTQLTNLVSIINSNAVSMSNLVTATSNNLFNSMLLMNNTVLTGSYDYTDARVEGTTTWLLDFDSTNSMVYESLAPISSKAGQFWFDTDNGQVYISTNKGSSTDWAQIVP